jgi:hypothetical protein
MAMNIGSARFDSTIAGHNVPPLPAALVHLRDHDHVPARGGRDVTRRNITIFGLGIISHRRAASRSERVPCEE